MTHRYDDILDTPWPQKRNRARMSIEDRAAQFAPFSALTGYDAVLQETARLTQGPIFLTEESQEALNRQLNAIARQLPRESKVCMTVYVEDARKEGGAFQTVEGRIKKLDLYAGGLILTDGREIPFSRICQIDIVDSEGE